VQDTPLFDCANENVVDLPVDPFIAIALLCGADRASIATNFWTRFARVPRFMERPNRAYQLR